MKKKPFAKWEKIVIVIIAIVLLVGGGFTLFHHLFPTQADICRDNRRNLRIRLEEEIRYNPELTMTDLILRYEDITCPAGGIYTEMFLTDPNFFGGVLCSIHGGDHFYLPVVVE